MSRPQPKRQRSESLNSGQKVSKPRVDKAGDTVKAAMRTLLRGVTEASDAFAPLKSAVGGLSFILNTIDQMGDNRAAAEKLSRRIEKISAYIGRPQIDGEEARRLELSCELDAARRILEPLENQGRVGRFIHSSQNTSLIEKYITSVDKAIADYQMCLIEGLHRVSVEQLTRGQRKAIEKLTRAKDAGFDAYSHRSRCLAGTRVEVLHTLYHWATGSDSRQVYWLNGHAGSGKSTIAQSFAEVLAEIGDLGASFFCSRDSQQRSDLKMIFPTIAFQLANAHNVDSPAYRTSLLRALAAESDIAFSSLNTQLEKLVITPARDSGLRSTIIIDALDECRDPNTTSIILDLLSSTIIHMPNIRFFITGRPESHIRRGFRLRLLRPLTEVMILHEVSPISVRADIKLFLQCSLFAIAETGRLEHVDLPSDWPSDSDVEVVTEKAAGLFIFAATVVKFIENRHHDPRDQLQIIVKDLKSSRHEGRTGLDALYLSILREVASDREDATFLLRLREILGLLVVANDFLHAATIADLVGLSRHSDVRTTLSSLHSLVLVPDDWTWPIRFHHKSFPDFLTDSSRCTDKRFFITPETHHFTIAQRCLVIMQQRLTKNIAGLPRYATNDSLDDALREQLLGAATGYSCRFWADHLLSDQGKTMHLLQYEPLLRQFLSVQQLHWFEALGLLFELRRAAESLSSLRAWLWTCDIQPTSQYQDLLDWINDGQKFVLYAFDAIGESVSHIYHSALPFAPEDSLLKKTYFETLAWEANVSGLAPSWDKSSRTIPTPGVACALAYAHNGSLLAAGGYGFSSIFRAATGEKVFDLDSSSDSLVHALSFSPDDTILATTSGDRMKLWDIRTGAISAELQNDRGDIVDMQFHPLNYQHLMVGDQEGNVSLWNVSSRQLERIFQIVGSCIGFCWLKGSLRLKIIMGFEYAIEIYDWSTPGPPRKFQTCVPSESVSGPLQAVASSNDGSYVASSSTMGSLAIYCTKTGLPIHVIHIAQYIRSCSLQFMLTGPCTEICYLYRDSKDQVHFRMVSHTVTNHDSPRQGATLHGHFDSIISFASSPDGQHVATGSIDQTIKAWDTQTVQDSSGHGSAYPERRQLERQPYDSAHFSEDGMFAVLRLWRSSSIVNSTGDFQIWETRLGRYLLDLPGTLDVQMLTILQGSLYVLIVRSSGEAAVLDMSSRVRDFVKHKRFQPQCVDWSGPFERTNIVPYKHSFFGFYYYSNDSGYITVECWMVRRQSQASKPVPSLVKVACGRICGQDWHASASVKRLYDARIPSWISTSLILFVELSSGQKLSATWEPVADFDSPNAAGNARQELQPLKFAPCTDFESRSESSSATAYVPISDSALVLQTPCKQVTDRNGATWVLDEKDRKVLWVPPAHCGPGAWWKKEKLILASRLLGRPTIVDFSKVNTEKILSSGLRFGIVLSFVYFPQGSYEDVVILFYSLLRYLVLVYYF